MPSHILRLAIPLIYGVCLLSCSSNEPAVAIDATLDTAGGLDTGTDAADVGPPDAIPPADECMGDADCDEGERCVQQDVDGFTVFVCECDPQPELCDGIDNDCNPDTPDGAEDPMTGGACDADDADLCEDGSWQCVDGSFSCDDDEESAIELCDGVDNDCNPETLDGSAEETLGDACDGADADRCADGLVACIDGILGCTYRETSSEDI